MLSRIKNTGFVGLVITTLFASCDPPVQEPVEENILLKAKISNTNEIIRLGDTLKVTFTLPDTLINIEGKKTYIQSLQECYYNMRIAKVDTVAKNRVDIVQSSEYFSAVGSNNNIQVFTTTSKPYQSIICFVPKTRGIYWLGVEAQSGLIRANNGYRANLRVNFDVSDKHFAMLGSYTTQAILSSLYQSDAEGIGYYGFRVY